MKVKAPTLDEIKATYVKALADQGMPNVDPDGELITALATADLKLWLQLEALINEIPSPD